MKRALIARLSLTGLAVLAITGMIVAAPSAEVKNFRTVWADKKASNLDKKAAVENLPKGEVDAMADYLNILESDTWQFRANVMASVRDQGDPAILAEYEKFLFDEKKSGKQPAAAEHILWALYNNKVWVSAEKWQRAPEIVKAKGQALKVKHRMLRELGVFRVLDPKAPDYTNADVQKQAKENVKILVGLLDFLLAEKKPDRAMLFLCEDALESLTDEANSIDAAGLAKWKFFAEGMKDDVPLTPRKGNKFSDPFAGTSLEGKTFARKGNQPRKAENMEILILPDQGNSSQYWFPYIFELNKTFSCTFIELPDCGRMKNLEYMRKSDGSEDKGFYYYPLTQMVEAFEARRENSGKKKVGLIAHGNTGWVVLEYLRMHPESVEFAVIIQTWSGRNAFTKSRDALENNKAGDKALGCLGKYMLLSESELIGRKSLDQSGLYWAQTGAYKRRWADPAALEPIFYSTDDWQVKAQTNAQPLVPDYEFEGVAKGKKIDLPVLFISGTKDYLSAPGDEAVYKKVFTKMKWLKFDNSADTPWAEEPVKFFDEFNLMIKENKIIEKLEKDGNEKKKN